MNLYCDVRVSSLRKTDKWTPFFIVDGALVVLTVHMPRSSSVARIRTILVEEHVSDLMYMMGE